MIVGFSDKGANHKTYGGKNADWAYSVQQTIDGGYIVAGGTASFGAGKNDVWILKTDPSGKELWNKTFGGRDLDGAYSVQQTPDGGYILAGGTWSFGGGKSNVWLIRIDNTGKKLWSKTFGGNGGDYAQSIEPTSDGGYVLAGVTKGFSAGGFDIWLIKIDSNGNKKWDKTFGGNKEDFSYSARETLDGGYIIVGYTSSYGAGKRDVWLIKTDSQGNKKWDKTFGGINSDMAYAVQQTPDGGYVVAGSTESFGAGEIDAWLIKTDSKGEELWNKTFGGNGVDMFRSLQKANDGGYILAGITDSRGAGDNDIWLIKTDSKGKEVWNKTYGGVGREYPPSIQKTSDGGYILAGSTDSFGARNDDVLGYLGSDQAKC